MYIYSIPSLLTCYGRSNINDCILSMTCHSCVSWTAHIFSSIHLFIIFLHHQMFTCMYAADEGNLSVFQPLNSLAMHLNMSLRLPGYPHSLPDGTVAQTAELKALIPHTRKVEVPPVPVLISYRTYRSVRCRYEVRNYVPVPPVPVLMSYRAYRTFRYRY